MSECTSITECIVNTKIVDIDSEIETELINSGYGVIQLLAWYISYNMGRSDYSVYWYCTRKRLKWERRISNYKIMGAYADSLINGTKPVTRSLIFQCRRFNKRYMLKVLKHFCTRYRCSCVSIDTGADPQKYIKYAIGGFDGHAYSLEIFVTTRGYPVDEIPMNGDNGYKVGFSKLKFGKVSSSPIGYIVDRYISKRAAEDFYCIVEYLINNSYCRSQQEMDIKNKVIALGRDQWSSLNWDFCFPYDMQNVSKLWDCYWELYVKPNEFFKRRR